MLPLVETRIVANQSDKTLLTFSILGKEHLSGNNWDWFLVSQSDQNYQKCNMMNCHIHGRTEPENNATALSFVDLGLEEQKLHFATYC